MWFQEPDVGCYRQDIVSEIKQSLRIRYRISVAILVLALGMVFVPMIFDSPRTEEEILAPMPHFEVSPTDELNDLHVDVTLAIETREKVESLIDAEGFFLSTGSPIGEPTLLPDSADAQQWAVQLAKFVDDTRASELRTQLSDSRYPAWIERVRIDGDEEISVFVGPFNTYHEAIEHRDKLAQELDIAPVIVALSI